MTRRRVELGDEAKAEARHAYRWYMAADPSSAAGFEAELTNAIERLETAAEGFPTYDGRTILGHLAHGSTAAEIVQEFPSVTEDDVRAVTAFAAAAAGEDLPAPTPIPPDVRVA